jgi:hypothetical protein
MNLLVICFLTLLISGFVFLASWGICCAIHDNMRSWNYRYWFLTWLIALIIGIGAWIGFTFIGVKLNTDSHKVFLQVYLVQKETIEMSLESDNLSGFERIELVKQATELNGELTKRKTYIKYWYSGVSDNTIYDNVEFINLNRGNKNG